MMSMQPDCLTIDELERQVKGVEPAAFLVPPRLLRRVIKHHCQIGGIGLLVPHRKGYVLDRESLLRCVQPEELGLASDAELPPFAFLLARPDPDRLARSLRDRILLKHWRILFHLRVDHAMQQKLADGSLTTTMVRQRIRRLGLTEFAEITDVLRAEDYLLPPESPEAVYAEFVAVYLTLRRFEGARVAHFFPALRDLAAVDALVAEDIDADVIYQATRLPGLEEGERGRKGEGDKGSVDSSVSPSPLLPFSPSPSTELDGLVDQLQKALELSDADTEKWRKALAPLVTLSADGSWSQETRFLYDLQSACSDSEHAIYTVDVVEWALSLGQLPIKRALPGHQEIAIVRHLRAALARVRLIRVTDAERQHLLELLTHALEHRERLTRDRFRPLIVSALDDVGLKPANVAEQVGRDKLIEELLDRVVEVGHLNIGNLRDAISRNQLKLPDLKGPGELLLGDPLIRLNRKLAVALDGVYRRGEFYMRLLHRLSSVAFGTALGRLLVLFLILPFGLAFFVMITPAIAIEEGEKLTTFVGQLLGLMEKAPAEHGHRAEHEFPLPNWWGVAGMGVFFVLLFHVARFRSQVFYGLGKVGHGLQQVHASAVGFIQSPLVQLLLHNRYWRFFRRCIMWPALMATNGGLFAWGYEKPTAVIAGVAAGCFALGIVLFNTRVVRDIEETGTDLLLRYWVWFTIDFVPGLLRLIMDVSRRCLDGVEQILYTVNEWTRSRGGENRVLLVVKAVLGLFVFLVTYVIRFAINLLIEPQINPIKHFPVVTVSHKVCLPMIPTLADILRRTELVSRPGTTATGIIFGIPGIFGFMVWELKENWKLYGSNRAANLKPVLIGSHGETMLRFLHPGFHSGTIPKLFKRLRRAERHETAGALGGPTVRKLSAALHHVEESIAHFIERELVALLRQSKTWDGLTIELGHIRLATNRVAVELRCHALGEQPLVFAFDHRCGWLLAGVLEAGWLPRLNTGQRQTLAAALAGLYKMAGVQATREQIAAGLPATTFAFNITDAGLVVWTGADAAHEAIYDLNGDASPANMPVLDMTKLMFANVPLAWQDWVYTCEGDHAEARQWEAALLPAARSG